LLDIFISFSQHIPNDEESYKLIAVTCLLVSAKSYERDDMIPKSSHLQHFLKLNLGDNQYTRSEKITSCERQILNTIDWHLETYPTFFSVLEIFRSQGVLFDSDKGPSGHTPSPHLVFLVDKYLDLFSLMCLQDANLAILNPYTVACAIVSASR
jgi:hypothetical protein